MNGETVETNERAAVIGASLLKKNAKAYYKQNKTRDADVLHAMARRLNEATDVSWDELDEVKLHEEEFGKPENQL